MSRSTGVVAFRSDGKTQWQMFLLLYVRHVGGHQHGVPVQTSKTWGETIFRITRE